MRLSIKQSLQKDYHMLKIVASVQFSKPPRQTFSFTLLHLYVSLLHHYVYCLPHCVYCLSHCVYCLPHYGTLKKKPKNLDPVWYTTCHAQAVPLFYLIAASAFYGQFSVFTALTVFSLDPLLSIFHL